MDARKSIAELATAVAVKDARLAQQDARLAQQDARLAQQDARLAQQDVQLAQLAQQSARIAELEALVAELLERVAVLTEQLGQNSSNSHKPPSSDPPGAAASKNKNREKRKRKQRKRGGQRGHKGHHRQLVPESEVAEFVDDYPAQCESCWEPLPETPDPSARRFQVTEVRQDGGRHVTEYRCHGVACACGHRTRARFGPDVPRSQFGPRLMSIVALLTGAYHLSRRKVVALLRDLFGVRISLGAVSNIEARVSKAVEPPVDEARRVIERAGIKHTDGTGWRRGGVGMAVWTIATTMATAFTIVSDSAKTTLASLFGPLLGILISDRANALMFWEMDRRQVCWAHLLRKFVSFSERDGPAARLGQEPLEYTGLMFEYWHAYKDGAISKATFRAWMTPVRAGVEAALERGAATDIKRLSGSCVDMLEHRLALWTFVDTDGVEPTNNHAERELRAFVLWRKTSFGSQSERGDRFAERVMTVAHTARKQGCDVLTFLTDCCRASADGASAPSLFDERFETAF